MMKKYIKPEMDIVEFKPIDILTTSGDFDPLNPPEDTGIDIDW